MRKAYESTPSGRRSTAQYNSVNYPLKKLNKGKAILIVGHSNTSPKLVNLLTGKDKYKELDESVYNTYWIVTSKHRKIKAKIIKY